MQTSKRNFLKSLFALPFAPLLAKLAPPKYGPSPLTGIVGATSRYEAINCEMKNFAVYDRDYSVMIFRAGAAIQRGEFVGIGPDFDSVIPVESPTSLIGLESAKPDELLKVLVNRLGEPPGYLFGVPVVYENHA